MEHIVDSSDGPRLCPRPLSYSTESPTSNEATSSPSTVGNMELTRGDTNYQDENCTHLPNEQQHNVEMDRTPIHTTAPSHCVLEMSESAAIMRAKMSSRDCGMVSNGTNSRLDRDMNNAVGRYSLDKLGRRFTGGAIFPQNTRLSFKHNGRSVLNRSSKYREEFLMITKQNKVTNLGICDSRIYKNCYISLVLLYAMLLGASTMLDWYTLSKAWICTIFGMRYAFTLLFSIDAVLRLTKKRKLNIFDDPELVFDVLLLLFEFCTLFWLTNMVRLHFDFTSHSNPANMLTLNQLRLSSCISLLRLYKLFKACQPLMSLSKGIMLSIRSLMWTGVFVLLVLYCCAIFTTWLFTEVPDNLMDDFWGTLPRSMYTLFTILTLEGWNDVSNDTAVHYPYAKIFFVVFVCFATLTVMNVVTGIILDTFLTVNEKLTGEKSCRGRCDRHIQVTQILTDALNDLSKRSADASKDPSANGTPCTGREMSADSKNRAEDHQSKESLEDSISNATDDSSLNPTFGKTWNTDRWIDLVGGPFKKVLTKTFQVIRGGQVDTTLPDGGDIRVRRSNLSSDISTSNCSAESYKCAAAETFCVQRLDRYGYTNGSKQYQQSCDSAYINRKAKHRTILEELMDEEDREAAANASIPSSKNHVGRDMVATSNHDVYVTILKQHERPRDGAYRESICSLMTDPRMGANDHLGDSSYANGIIDMTQVDPYAILTDPVIQRALSLAGVPMYQAYEVLNLYHINQLYRLTVHEFVEACDRLTGNASSKEILSFELTFTRRLDVIETALSQLDGKLTTILEHIGRT